MSFMKRGIVFSVLLVPLLCAAPPRARALNNCGLLCSCTLSTGAISIGSYNPISGDAATGTGSVTVSCQLLASLGAVLVPFTVSLSQGQSGSFAPRKMTGPSSGQLQYNLYSDPGLSTVWGDGTGGSQLLVASLEVSVLNLLVPQLQTIYALIPGGQNVAVGNYSDTITATLQF